MLVYDYIELLFQDGTFIIKKLGNGDGFSRLISQCKEDFEGNVIVSLVSESKIKGLGNNTIKDFPVTIDDICRAYIEWSQMQTLLQKCHLHSSCLLRNLDPFFCKLLPGNKKKN